MTGSNANWQSLQTSGGLALASLARGVPRLHFISSTSPIEMESEGKWNKCTPHIIGLLRPYGRGAPAFDK